MFLKVEKLCKQYSDGEGSFFAINQLDLSLNEKEICIVLGESGSGKSTFINLIGGLDTITSGSVLVDNVDISKMTNSQLSEYRRKYVGFIFQFYNLIKNLTVRENVEVCARLSEDPLDIDELLEVVGLSEHKKKYPAQLSGGQQQRVAIARALVKNPKLLLCDEPTGALDSKTSKQVLKLIESVNKKYKTTIVMITHNKAVGPMADRVITLLDGKVVQDEQHQHRTEVQQLAL